jgi:hypothetical protein
MPTTHAPAQRTQSQIAKDFMLGGDAIFTLTRPDLDQRFTYRVTRKGANDPHFVKLLTGPDNTRDYTYLGILDPDMGYVILTERSGFPETAPSVRAIRWAAELLWEGHPLPTPAEIHHEGMCARCRRPLTVPESIRTGFGPECAARLGRRGAQA